MSQIPNFGDARNLPGDATFLTSSPGSHQKSFFIVGDAVSGNSAFLVDI